MLVIVYDEPGIKFCEPLPNDWHKSGIELKRQLIEAGYDVKADHEGPGDPDKDIALYFDALLRPKHPPLHKRSLYVSLEPPVVSTQRRFYDRIDGWPYTRILTFSRAHVNDKRVFFSPYPAVKYIDFELSGIYFNGSKAWAEVEKRREEWKSREYLCAITANKTSGHPEELYTARREIYRAMGSKLHLYGHGWQNDAIVNHVDYKGPCVSNFDTFCRYKYAISIENQWLEGYASEKYWTPIQAGCELQTRIGWKPDFSLSDCDESGWSKRIVEHIGKIA